MSIDEFIRRLGQPHPARGINHDMSFGKIAGFEKEKEDFEDLASKLNRDSDIEEECLDFMHIATKFGITLSRIFHHSRQIIEAFGLQACHVIREDYCFPLPDIKPNAKINYTVIPDTVDRKINEIVLGAHDAYSRNIPSDLLEIAEAFENATQTEPEKLQEYIEKIEKIKQYPGDVYVLQNDIMPALMACAMYIDGLYFDLMNLIKDEFSSRRISKVIKISSGLPNFGEFPACGLANLLASPSAFNTLHFHKRNYIKSNQEKRRKGLYLPFAVLSYASNLHETIDATDVNIILNVLKQKEFADYLSREEYEEYILMVERKSGVHMLGRALKMLEQDEEIMQQYAELFNSAENRTEDWIEFMAAEDFVQLWKTACENEWNDSLAKNLDAVQFVYELHGNLVLFNKFNTASPVVLLKHEGFRNHFARNKSENFDFDSLYQIMRYDNQLFEKVYPLVSGRDEKFLKNLLRLANSCPEKPDFDITSESRKFIESLHSFSGQQVSILSDYSRLQKAVDFGLTEFRGRLFELPVQACVNIAEKKESLLKRLDAVEKITSYMGEYKSTILRDRLADVFLWHGEDFIKKYLKPVYAMGPLVYSRVCDVAASVGSCKDLFRKREYSNALRYVASELDEWEWQKFKAQLRGARNGSFCDLCEKAFSPYSAISKGEAVERSKEIGGPKEFVEAYAKVKGTENEYLIDKLLEVAEDAGAMLFTGICSHVISGNLKLASLILNQLENGMPRAEAEKLLFYECDADIDLVHPTELVPRLYEKQQEQEQEEQAESEPEFNYTAFDNYARENGFSPELVRITVEDGFKLHAQGKFIGENYIPYRHVKKTVTGKHDNSLEVEQQFHSLISWLKSENVILHHVKKHRNLTDGCLSINPHSKDVSNPALREYLAYAMYGGRY
jgi:hypothetical protein